MAKYCFSSPHFKNVPLKSGTHTAKMDPGDTDFVVFYDFFF